MQFYEHVVALEINLHLQELLETPKAFQTWVLERVAEHFPKRLFANLAIPDIQESVMESDPLYDLRIIWAASRDAFQARKSTECFDGPIAITLTCSELYTKTHPYYLRNNLFTIAKGYQHYRYLPSACLFSNFYPLLSQVTSLQVHVDYEEMIKPMVCDLRWSNRHFPRLKRLCYYLDYSTVAHERNEMFGGDFFRRLGSHFEEILWPIVELDWPLELVEMVWDPYRATISIQDGPDMLGKPELVQKFQIATMRLFIKREVERKAKENESWEAKEKELEDAEKERGLKVSVSGLKIEE